MARSNLHVAEKTIGEFLKELGYMQIDADLCIYHK